MDNLVPALLQAGSGISVTLAFSAVGEFDSKKTHFGGGKESG
jgi:hypothetical protein